MHNSTIGAVVVGGQHPGLGVARSLGSRGIPVVVVDDQPSVAAVSRYATRSVRVPDLLDERRTVENLISVARRFHLDGWVLYPTRDETVAACARHRTELAKFFRVTTPDWKTVQWAYDKKKTYELATRLNVPCPVTFNPRSGAELAALVPRLPLAIKPAVKENFFYATGAKAWRADTADELRDTYARARQLIPAEQVLVQEIVPGDGASQFSYCAFFRDGAAHGVLLARRERQHPREFGRAATYVETIELPEIEALAERFLNAIDFYGLVEIEFKRDSRDGHFKLLDVNARTWGFQALGRAAGVDFPYLLFADQVGYPTTPARGIAGKSWLRLITDAPTSALAMVRRELTFSSYVRSLKRMHVESVFDVRDPLPAIAEIALLPLMLRKSFL
jgi:D-aspartate ligase